MSTEEIETFNKIVISAILKAGEYVLTSQGTVKNIGKTIKHLPLDLPEVERKRAAKTIVDEQVQDIILHSIRNFLLSHKISVDAEEKSKLSSKFVKKSNITLVIDPIDGTLEYLKGDDCYSVCVGLIEKGKMISAFIYFPKRKSLFFLDEKQHPFLSHDGSSIQPLLPQNNHNKKQVFKMNRVSENVKNKLKEKGYAVKEDIANNILWPDALLDMLNGEYVTCIFHSPQIRDVLLGAIISNTLNGFALDWKGNKLIWPQGGRIPYVIFGIGKLPKDILECLNR